MYTSLRSITEHTSGQENKAAFSAGDGGVEPATAVEITAPKPIIPDDDILPLRPLRFVRGDGPSKRRLGQVLFLLPVPIMAIPVESDVVLEMPLVEAQTTGAALLIQRFDARPSSSVTTAEK